jgi:AraC-like DNA-binding protein
VHLLHGVAKELEKKGHHLFYSVREIPVAIRLMEYYGMTPYLNLGKKKDSLIGKAWTVLHQDGRLLRFVRRNHIDVGLSSGLVLGHVSKLTKMKSVMERFVADTTFSVDVFCSEMSMSRMNFYRKMHALTGLTPAQYINDYRLTLADRLLREGELNVSEVADRTGFTTASYFSKCYKTKFGVAPKEVRIK